MGHEGVVCAPISTLRITAEITAALLITCEVFTSQYLSGIGGLQKPSLVLYAVNAA